MSKNEDLLAEEVDALRRLRDELRVKLHLAKAEAREGFEELEKKWRHLEARMELVAKESRDASVDVREAAKLLASELREAYHRVKQLI